VDGVSITTIRTAAVSGLATRLLAREDAGTHGVLGAGVQARAHIEAIAAARPQVRDVLIWARDFDKASALAASFAGETAFKATAVRTAAEAAGADIVSAVTRSPTPVVLGADVRPGTHINLVGAYTPETREADTDCVVKATIYVEQRQAALTEAGDILIPMRELGADAVPILGEIGEVAAGTLPGRVSPAQVTLFKSLGLVVQDLLAADAVVHALENR
jgi:ornithine cyclodeaminase